MKISELIEILAEEESITPHAEVVVSLPDITPYDGEPPGTLQVVGLENNGQEIMIICDQCDQ